VKVRLQDENSYDPQYSDNYFYVNIESTASTNSTSGGNGKGGSDKGSNGNSG
jgi:hypothetical protein